MEENQLDSQFFDSEKIDAAIEEIKREKQLKKNRKSLARKRWMRKYLWIVLCIVLVFVTFQYLKSDAFFYRKAQGLYRNDSWTSAIVLFNELDDYKDSRLKADSCTYNIANYHLAQQEWSDALPLFQGLGELGDSQLKADTCSYSIARTLCYQEEWLQAALIFKELGTFYDSQLKADTCIYFQANLYYQAEQWSEATALYEELELFRDSESRLFFCGLYGSFVTIPAGSFQMGSPSSEDGHSSSESPVHEVHIQSFEMMSTELTQGLWTAVMGENSSQRFGVGANYPVFSVSWNDCHDFLEKLNEIDSRYSYRLPTESEWEYACRAGTTTRFYWGEDDYYKYMWGYANSRGRSHLVATREPNAWGLYDMSGNVWEWCQDAYTRNYAYSPNDGSANEGGYYRVFRGGSWNVYSFDCRSAERLGFPRSYAAANLGFRIVRVEKLLEE